MAHGGRARLPCRVPMNPADAPTADTLRAYRDLGIVRVVLGSGRDGWHDPATTYPFLDRYTPLVDELA